MLGLGWTEMLIVGVVALIVIGPKDLPVVMNRIGKFAGMVRRMGNEFQREISKSAGLDEVKNLRNSITAPLKQTTAEIRREFNAMGAGGTIKPSGVIKPADPKAESVVDEIHAAAGLTTPDTAAVSSTSPAASAAPLVSSEGENVPDAAAMAPKRIRATRVKTFVAPPSTVVTSDLPHAESAAGLPEAARPARRARAKTVSPEAPEAVPATPKRAARRVAAPSVTAADPKPDL